MKRIILTLTLLLFFVAHANIISFNTQGDRKSNDILKNFAYMQVQDDNMRVSSYFYDLDGDGIDEIIGVVKSKYFYTLAGYKFFALKTDGMRWKIINSNIYLDTGNQIEINKNKITFHKNVNYNYKKYKATIKKDSIKQNISIYDWFKDNQTHDIERIVKKFPSYKALKK